jgi:hypothetical protein
MAKTPTPSTGCLIKQLPSDMILAAAATAIRENRSNGPSPRAAAMLDNPSPTRLAMLTEKYWGPTGVNLGVAFMETTSPEVQNKILAHANLWSKGANINFKPASKSVAEVRISLEPGNGYASYLGTDILHIPSGEPTMWLDSFSLEVPDSEYMRVVPHEFGHTAGFPHEHMRKEIGSRLDKEKTIAAFKRWYGWTAKETTAQVFVTLEERAIIATPLADETSIMTYSFPASITKDGKPIVGGTQINDLDYRFAADRYPPTVVQPPVNTNVTLILPADYKAGTYTLAPLK